jgi:predicted DNA-binding transcriptional regulator YafY
MKRVNRITAILIQLQSKQYVSAKEISNRFNISVRTVYRDIRALEDSGVPIGSENGKGYFIVDGYYLPPVSFTEDEASALLFGSKLTDKHTDAKIKDNYVSSLLKIKSVITKNQKEKINTLDSMIFVDDSGFKKSGESFLFKIQSILGLNKLIEIDYHSNYKDEGTNRVVEPIGLYFYGNYWHLIAYCRLRKDYRDFRIDRIKSLIITDESFSLKKRKSLENLIKDLYSSVSYVKVKVRFKKDVLKYIGDTKYYYGLLNECVHGKFVEMTFLTYSLDYFARWVLNFTDTVEIIYPKRLSDRLLELVKCLNEHYKK